MQKIGRISLFIFVFLSGILYRSQELLAHNFLFLEDQGRDMMAVKDIVYGHHLTLIGPYTSLQGVFQGPLWYYLLSIPTILTHGDPWGGIALMWVISILVLLSVFFSLHKLFGFTTGIIGMAFVAFCPEAIAAATFAWNPHPMWLLITLFLFVLYLSTIHKKWLFLLWSLIALMFHFETAMGVVIAIASIIFSLIYLKKWIISKENLYGILLSILFFSPQIIFDVRHNFLMTHSLLRVFQGSNQGLIVRGEHLGILHTVPNNLQALLTNYLSSFVPLPGDRFVPFLLLVLVVCTFFVIKIGNRYLQQKDFIEKIGVVTCIIIILELFYPFPLRFWFITGFQIAYILLISVVLGIIANRIIGKLGIMLLFILFLYFSFPGVYKKYAHPDYGGVAKYQGKLDAVKYLYSDSHYDLAHVLIFTPPVYTDPYDYLLWWYAKNNGYRVPDSQKNGTFYLLMETNPYEPWSYQGWLETVIKSGKIVITTTLPSGLIIQKRQAQ